MKRMFRTCVLALPIVMLAAVPASADVKARSKTQMKFEGMLGRMMGMFGGKAAKDGIESTTSIKGDREVTLIGQSMHIIDLSEEKIYDVDLKKKSYTVMTFDEMRRKMQEAQARAQKDAGKAEGGQQKPEKELEVDFDVKKTGQKKQLAGYDTEQAIVTITVREKGKTLEEGGGLVMTIDNWLGPKIPAMKEVADFQMRFFQKLNGSQATGMSADQMAAAYALFPMMKDAMERWQKEAGDLDGTPLASTMTVEAVKSPEDMQREQENGGGGGLTGMFAKKLMKHDDAKPRATIVTMNHEVLEISTSVTADDLAIPAGFKEKK